MFYERWLQVVHERGREIALIDLAAGQQWSFLDLARLADTFPKPAEPIVYPQGHSAEFILAVLRAWRWQVVVCPLESGQSPWEMPLPPWPCVHLKSTSATAGAPRAIAFTAPQLAADAENIVATMGLRVDWPNLGAISLAHSYGFSNLVLPLLLHGIPLIIAPSVLPETIRRAVARETPLTLPAVPALWRIWHEAGAIPSNVHLAISAGAPLPLSLEQSVFASTRIKIHNFYGSSECGGIAYDRSAAPRQDDAGVGRPMENVGLSLNEEGCLCVHSRAVGETYWPAPAETLGAGRFQTSDLAELKDGAVYLRGRASDLINIAGRKVSSETIERALMEHQAVRDCLVFDVPSIDANRTDLIVACVVTSAPVPAERLKQFLLNKLPAWQVPREWWFVESLAANCRGKVSRSEWRKQFLRFASGRDARQR